MNKPEKISGTAPRRITEIADGAPLRILLPSYRSDPHTGGHDHPYAGRCDSSAEEYEAVRRPRFP